MTMACGQGSNTSGRSACISGSVQLMQSWDSISRAGSAFLTSHRTLGRPSTSRRVDVKSVVPSSGARKESTCSPDSMPIVKPTEWARRAPMKIAEQRTNEYIEPCVPATDNYRLPAR